MSPLLLRDAWRGPCALLLLACAVAHAAPPAGERTLWISDDVGTTIHHVALDGTPLSSFPSGSISGLALGIGAEADTLWAAKEGSNRIVHFDGCGATLQSFSGATYDPDATRPEGVAVDFADATLWIVDDTTHLAYNVLPDGSLLSSFSTLLLQPPATSCQDVASDPSDGTLWLTDNVAHHVYNVTRQGTLVSAFPVSAFDPNARNVQGICVDGGDGTLWITDRNTRRVYHVTRAGALLAAFDATLFGSSNPTGIAVEPGAAWTDLCQSLPGLGGSPALAGDGPLLAGTQAALALTDARPGAPASLLVGLSALGAPFKGGVLVPAPDLIVTLATDPSGTITLSAAWPAGLPAGTRLWLQWWIVDAAAPLGLAASNALLATTP